MWPSFRLSHLIHRSCPRYFHPQGPKIAKTCSGKNRGILILFKCTEVVHTCSVINLPFANFTCPVVLKNLCQCAIAWTKLATLFRRKVVHRFAKKTAACILLAKILSFNSQKDVLPISWSISVVERMRKNVFLFFLPYLFHRVCPPHFQLQAQETATGHTKYLCWSMEEVE